MLIRPALLPTAPEGAVPAGGFKASGATGPKENGGATEAPRNVGDSKRLVGGSGRNAKVSRKFARPKS